MLRSDQNTHSPSPCAALGEEVEESVVEPGKKEGCEELVSGLVFLYIIYFSLPYSVINQQ